MGRDLTTQFSVELQPPPTFEELDLGVARGRAIMQRPEVRKAGLQGKKAELDIRRERAEYIPNLSFQLSYTSFANISFAPQNLTHAGFLFEWQPFDWGQRKHRIEQLRTVSQQATLMRLDAEQQILLDVGAQYRKLQEADDPCAFGTCRAVS